jgi:exonuclease III
MWMGAKEIDDTTKRRTMYWEDVSQPQSEEILRIIRETKLIAYVVGSASYNRDRRELSAMTASMDDDTIEEERQALELYWAEGDQPGRFNRARGFSLVPLESTIIALRAGNPDIPHAVSLAGILEGVKEASGLVLSTNNISVERIDRAKTPTWKVTADTPATAALVLSVGGILVNYEEYFFSEWLDFSETRFIVNIKGVPIQVKPKELTALILGYAGVAVREVEFVKKKGVYQNYVRVNAGSEEDRTKLVATSPAPLLSGLPAVRFVRPATADQIKKVPPLSSLPLPCLPPSQCQRSGKRPTSPVPTGWPLASEIRPTGRRELKKQTPSARKQSRMRRPKPEPGLRKPDGESKSASSAWPQPRQGRATSNAPYLLLLTLAICLLLALVGMTTPTATCPPYTGPHTHKAAFFPHLDPSHRWPFDLPTPNTPRQQSTPSLSPTRFWRRRCRPRRPWPRTDPHHTAPRTTAHPWYPALWLLITVFMANLAVCNAWNGVHTDLPSMAAGALTLATYNIRRNWRELSTLCSKARDKHWDILLVQEVGLLADHYIGGINKAAEAAGYTPYWNLKLPNELTDKRERLRARQALLPNTRVPRRRLSSHTISRKPQPSGGLLTLVSNHLVPWTTHTPVPTPKGHTCQQLQHLKLHVHGHTTHIYNVYAPSGNATKHDTFTSKYIQPITQTTSRHQELILGGDWNQTPGDGERWSNFGTTRASRSMRTLRRFLLEDRLTDVHKQINPNCNRHTRTWVERNSSTTTRITSARIDFFLTNTCAGQHTTGSYIHDAIIDSDHVPVSMTLTHGAPQRNALPPPTDPLRLHSHLLLNQDVAERVRRHMQDNADQDWELKLGMLINQGSLSKVQDQINTLISNAMMAHAIKPCTTPQPSHNAKIIGQLKGHRKKLLCGQNNIVTSIRVGTHTPMNTAVLLALNKEGVSPQLDLQCMAQHLSKAIQQTSRRIRSEERRLYSAGAAKATEDLIQAGYCNQRRFWQMLRPRAKDATIAAVKIANSDPAHYSSDHPTILNGFASWWGNQFTRTEDCTGPQPWWDGETCQVSRKNNQKLTAAITLTDVNQAIHHMRSTAPGTDHITTAMLRLLPAPAQAGLVQVFNCCLKDQDIPASWREAAITLIHKDGDRADPGNYRPISLLQVQYKVYTNILTQRLYKAVNKDILSIHQNGFRPRLATGDCLRALHDVVEDSNCRSTELHLLYVDMRKAYDSVSHDSITHTLTNYGVDPLFVAAIARLYRNCHVRVKVNQELSHPLTYGKGVRQGDGLSPLLFIVVLNPLIKWLACPNGQHGHTFISGYRLPVLAYADDIVLCGRSFSDINHMFNKLTQFYQYYNLQVNQAKSGYTTNSKDNQHNLYFDGQAITKLEPHEHYKYLGVWFNLRLCWDRQRTETERKVRAFTAIVNKRRIPALLLARVMNAGANAIIAYSMPIINHPRAWLTRMENALASLLRSKLNLPPRYDLEPMFMSVSDGGIGLVSLLALQEAHNCSSTTLLLNAGSIATATILASMSRDRDNRDILCAWKLALKVQDIDPWINWTDRNQIHVGCGENNRIWKALYTKSIHRWDQVNGASSDERRSWISKQIQPCWGDQDDYDDLEQARSRAQHTTTSPGLPTYVPPSGPTADSALQSELHWNHATNKVRVWTDGGYKDGQATAGIHWSDSMPTFNQSILINHGTSSLEGELAAIQTAVDCAPEGVHLEIVTDCKSAVSSISGFKGWKRGRQERTSGRSIIKDVNANIRRRRKAGFTIDFTYVPSHVPEKEQQAQQAGKEAVSKWNNKMASLRDCHGADLDSLIAGNVNADALATRARTKHTSTTSRNVRASRDGVALRHLTGRLIEKDVASAVRKAEESARKTRQSKKASRGEYLRDTQTSFPRSYDICKGQDHHRTQQWLHAARFKSQCPNAERIHLFWERDKTNLDQWHGREYNGKPETRAVWEADKALHSTQGCPLCSSCLPTSKDTMLIVSPVSAHKEMHHHVYTSCPATSDLRTARDEEVKRIILSYAPNPRIPIEEVPLWFADNQATGQSKATEALALYNKHMGALAFCPLALPAALKDIGVPEASTDECIRETLTAIAKAGRDIWSRRLDRTREVRRNWLTTAHGA